LLEEEFDEDEEDDDEMRILTKIDGGTLIPVEKEILIPGASKTCDKDIIDDAMIAVKKYSNSTGLYYKSAICNAITEGIHINILMHNCTNDLKDSKDCDAIVHYNATGDK